MNAGVCTWGWESRGRNPGEAGRQCLMQGKSVWQRLCRGLVEAHCGVCRAAVLSPHFKGAKALLEKSVCGEHPAPSTHTHTTHTNPRCCGSEQLPLEEARGAGVSLHRCFHNGELHNRRKWSRARVLQQPPGGPCLCGVAKFRIFSRSARGQWVRRRHWQTSGSTGGTLSSV